MSCDIPSFKEDPVLQVPALELLPKLGYAYLRLTSMEGGVR